MGIVIDIPDSALEGATIPLAEIERRARLEIAVALYVAEAMSLGKAAEVAAIDRFAFSELLAERGIPRHYSPEMLEEDLADAGGQ